MSVLVEVFFYSGGSFGIPAGGVLPLGVLKMDHVPRKGETIEFPERAVRMAFRKGRRPGPEDCQVEFQVERVHWVVDANRQVSVHLSVV
jgi:hypothetical protein